MLKIPEVVFILVSFLSRNFFLVSVYTSALFLYLLACAQFLNGQETIERSHV